MKWRITGRYLSSVVLIVVIVIFINLFVIIGLFVYQNQSPKDPLFQEEHSAEAFTRAFKQEILLSKSGIDITGQGKEALERKQAWIQVLDENGNQSYGFRVPHEAKSKYTPMDIVQTYKYREQELMSTVFIGEKLGNGERYSYLIGFQNLDLQRNILTYDSREVGHILQIGVVLVLIIDSFVALCIAYLFSKRLTRPLTELIDGIKQLAHKNFKVHFETKGIYKEVFHNVNILSLELRAGELERKKLDQMKEEWIVNISHDIKTPLASIQGYSEMMRDKDYDFTVEEMQGFAEIIEQKSLYLKEVIEDLNLSTRLRNKGLSLNLKSVNLVSLVRNTVIDTLNESQYSSRNISFKHSDDVILKDVDEILIRRAVTNLIYNAVVHNSENVSIVVSVEKKGEKVQIVVEDHGSGIRKEELERIFDRYYRGTHTGGLHKGSGLGMAIANDIVKAHDGEIHVISEVDVGTRIEISL